MSNLDTLAPSVLGNLTPSAIAILVLGALLIGISKAGFGGGPGMLVPPMLAMFLPPKIAVGLVLPLLLATDIFALRFYWGRWESRNVRAILPGAIVGIAAGTTLLAHLDPDGMKKAIGLLAVLLGTFQLVRERFTSQDKVMAPVPWLGAVAGVVSGVGSALAHQGGVPVTLYLLPQRLSSGVFVATTTAIFFFINAAKVVPYIFLGMLPASSLVIDLALLPIVYAGTAIGVRLNERVPKAWFMRVVLFFVLLTGFKLLLSK